MVFPTYQAFRTSLQWLIEGDELTNTFSINVLDLIVGLGEARVYRDLRASTMLSTFATAAVSNAVTLPTDLLELKEVRFDGQKPCDIIPLDRLRALEADAATTGYDVAYCAQDGDTLRFWPVATDTALGSYYAKPGALADATTPTLWALQTTFARYPEVFIYACLVEAMPFLGMEAKVPMWDGRYAKALSDALADERMRVYAGGPLRMRTR
jgi:hypothetical protein